ncbi:MAG: hypothetical protein WEB57_13310 [Pseudohongiellaceae bacterium]
MPVSGLLAALSSLGGVILLYLSWRTTWPSGSVPARLTVAGGWLLQAVAACLWVRASNMEFGLTYALLVLTLSAWALTVFNREIRSGRQRAAESGRIMLPGTGTLGRQALRLAAAVPLAGASAAFTAIALTSLLPWPQASQLSTGVLVMPVLWGAASAWTCADPQPWRPVLFLLIALLLTVLFLYA